ncbi:MAG: 30S ribosomal protein S17 [Thermodesulfobacteriota bacterium]|nr:30S ribosomal protein S17 [Thermodesulfobacteriota bacterium]
MTERGLRKKLVGTVVSNRMEKTALIMVERLTKHPKYGKYVRRRKRYMAHDPKDMCNIGDKVRIVESRPISKRKRWQVINVIGKSKTEKAIELK